MANKVQHIRSNVSGKVPDPNELKIGEIAINTADRKVFTKEPGGTIVEIGGVHYASHDEILNGTVTDKCVSPEGLHSILVERVNNLRAIVPRVDGVTGAIITFSGSVDFDTVVVLEIHWMNMPAGKQKNLDKFSIDVTNGMTAEAVRDALYAEIQDQTKWSGTPHTDKVTKSGYAGLDFVARSTSTDYVLLKNLKCIVDKDINHYVPQLSNSGYLDWRFLHPSPRIGKTGYNIGDRPNDDFTTIRECFDTVEGYFNDPGGSLVITLSPGTHTWDAQSCFPRNVGRILFDNVLRAKPVLNIDQIDFNGVCIEFIGINLISTGKHCVLYNSTVLIKNCVVDHFKIVLGQKSLLDISSKSVVKNQENPFSLNNSGAELYIDEGVTLDNLTTVNYTGGEKRGIVSLTPNTKVFLSKNIIYTGGTTKTVTHGNWSRPIPALDNNFNELNFNNSLAYDEDFIINSKTPGPYADNTAALAAGLTAGQQYYTATGDVKVVI